MTSQTAQSRALISDLADDTEMQELIEFYLDELVRKVEVIKACLVTNNRSGVEVAAHQLKGSSVGYGFPTIGEVAGELELELQRSSLESGRVQMLTRELLDLCARALMN